jgi:hypothetical protein
MLIVMVDELRLAGYSAECSRSRLPGHREATRSRRIGCLHGCANSRSSSSTDTPGDITWQRNGQSRNLEKKRRHARAATRNRRRNKRASGWPEKPLHAKHGARESRPSKHARRLPRQVPPRRDRLHRVPPHRKTHRALAVRKMNLRTSISSVRLSRAGRSRTQNFSTQGLSSISHVHALRG